MPFPWLLSKGHVRNIHFEKLSVSFRETHGHWGFLCLKKIFYMCLQIKIYLKRGFLRELLRGALNTQQVLVSLGCSNRTPQAGWLQQQSFDSHSSGAWEVQGQGTGRHGVWWEPSSWLTDANFSLYLLVVREEYSSPASSNKGYPCRLCPHELPTSQRPHL